MNLKIFRQPNTEKIVLVLLTSLLPYLLLLFFSFKLSAYSYWYVILLAVPAHWFHARLFIIMHDCGHLSFFRTSFFNNLFGHITAFFFYTPFFMWRELHNKHHAYQGNLDKRNLSLDVWTLTLNEYTQTGPFKKWLYRCYRHPAILLGVSPFVLFFVIFRFPFEKFSTKAVLNIFLLDLVLILLAGQSWFLTYFLIQLPSLILSLIMASFLFYVQHQFENTLWVSNSQFTNKTISLGGSSYYRLPLFFDWCYGHINYHHLHHLDVKIPMYHLPEAQRLLQHRQTELSVPQSLKALRLALWDESKQKLVAFRPST